MIDMNNMGWLFQSNPSVQSLLPTTVGGTNQALSQPVDPSILLRNIGGTPAPTPTPTTPNNSNNWLMDLLNGNNNPFRRGNAFGRWSRAPSQYTNGGLLNNQ